MPETPNSIAAVRGAIQVAANRADLVQAATARLLVALLERNRLEPAQIVSAIFTATPDLDADFPAHAARRLGWTDVPLLGAVEVAVPGAMPRVVRVLLTVGGVRAGARLAPVYLDGAAALRPDLAAASAPGSGPATPARERRTIAIIGLGQIGGSIGFGLAASGRWRRVGFDRDTATAARALEAGAVDESAISLAEACRDADLAVVAVPVDAIPDVVRAAAALLPAGAALMDTGSTRIGLEQVLEEARRRGIRALGGHPLAGREGHGFAAADAELFRGATIVFCVGGGDAPKPGDSYDPGLLTRLPPIVLDLVADLGATGLIRGAADHDAALARTSHLPYLLARAIRTIGAEWSAQGLSGPTFRDMTRVAASDPRVAEAYCAGNRREILDAWHELRSEMARLIDALPFSGAAGQS